MIIILDNGNSVCFAVELTTKAWASEISWSIGTCSSKERYKNRQKYSTQCCMPAGDYTLTCKDSYGDGWHGGYIKINGKTFCKNFRSGKETKSPVNISEKPNSGNLFFLI